MVPVRKLGRVLRAYVKIRAIVRKARSEKWSRDDLVQRLMLSVRRHEVSYLERISRTFYKADLTLTAKRRKLGWGNSRKIHDRLHKLLADEVARWGLKSKLSKNY